MTQRIDVEHGENEKFYSTANWGAAQHAYQPAGTGTDILTVVTVEVVLVITAVVVDVFVVVACVVGMSAIHQINTGLD